MPATSPQVGILMGSDSDWPKIKAAADALDEFGVLFEEIGRASCRERV